MSYFFSDFFTPLQMGVTMSKIRLMYSGIRIKSTPRNFVYFYYWISLIKAFYYLFINFNKVEVCYIIIK